MSAKAVAKTLTFRDLLTVDFYRYLIRACALFLPGILFLVLTYFCFWKLTQGKDLMIITLEHYDTFAYFILAQIFWAYVTWYSSRIVGKAKYFQQRNDHPVWTTFRVQGPRLMAFTCFSLIILAFFQLPVHDLPRISQTVCHILLFVSFVLYFVLDNFFNRVVKRMHEKSQRGTYHLFRLRKFIFLLLVILMVAVMILKEAWALVILLFVLQVSAVLLLIIRRHIIERMGASFFQQKEEDRGFTPTSSVFRQLRGLVTDHEDRAYFKGFNIVSALAGVVYLLTVISVTFAVWIGSFPFVLIAFSVLLGLGNFVSTVSILGRFNFHLLFIAGAMIMSWLFEPHYTKLPDKENHQVVFRNRQKLNEYFTNWVAQHKAAIDSVDHYPVYFVLANGGASRSGYWTASVLSLLEDTTQGKFSEHLFALSGASGGSVGNATFFSLLRNKDRLAADTSASPYLKASTTYLGSDFLTYTLARMLGPDVFRYIFPLRFFYDRAAALSHALEQAPDEDDFMFDGMAVPFSEFSTQVGKPYGQLPLLCINTTRMQDGSPAVISNLNVSDGVFNSRVDVLNLLDSNEDMKLSSAVVLGASFPYVSPAGRIDFTDPRDSLMEPQYFVDGGYFDNSGSGVVNEMINGLWAMMNNPSHPSSAYKNKLQFYIIHITNEPVGIPIMHKVSPIVNDIAAPLKTMVGSFNTQTSVNDLRLKAYMRGVYKDNAHYTEVNLYRSKEKINYSMNWVISEYLQNAMDERLRKHDTLNALIGRMHQQLR